MSYDDAIGKMLELFALNYQGRFDVTNETRPLWHTMLRGARPESIAVVAMEWVRGNEWPPSVADMRKRLGLIGSGNSGGMWNAPGVSWKRPPALPEREVPPSERTARHLAILRQTRQRSAERPERVPGERARMVEFYDQLIAQIEAEAKVEPPRDEPRAPLRSNFAAALAIAVVLGLTVGWHIARPARRVARETAAVVASGFDFGEGYRMNLAAMSVGER